MKNHIGPFRLRFRTNEISKWANLYSYEGESAIVEELAPRARKRGYLLRSELVQLARWKTPRSQSHILKNEAGLVEDVTRTALSTSREEIRIGVLLVLRGVAWPTASVILHFCSMDDYPILDFRALWSLGIDKPPTYNFPFWWEYTKFLRGLKSKTDLDMRTIDRALWRYSSEKQNTRRGV